MATSDGPGTPDAGGERLSIDVAGSPWSAIAWGDPDARPLLLVHGVTSAAAIWWRVGPRLAATGRRVVAVDLPGHGRTGHWSGRYRWRETAEDLVAFVAGAGLDRSDLQVIAHSWGAAVAANLPAAGLCPATIVLLDPPALPVAIIAQMASDPTWRVYDDPVEAVAAVAAANPTWDAGDVAAAADAMRQVDVDAAKAIVLENGDWDAGLGALADPAAAGVPVWLVRGEPAAGGLTLDHAAAEFVRRYGEAHVITIPGAPHSPQRTHLEATVRAFEHALGGSAPA
jgi:pimeloyl-ACP methyl ester carboxylesterase